MNKPNIPADAGPNDYVKVDFVLASPSTDACDLLADSLGAAGFESFVPEEDGSAMTAYVPAPQFSADAIDEAVAEMPLPVDITWKAEFVKGRDWNSEWEKNYFKPIVIDGKVAVHSSFHTDIPKAPYDIVIDPKMAFGTGHHATTTLMMKSLLEDDVSGKHVVDMGTGTGILAILASMLGAADVFAVEIDPFAVANARINTDLNLGDKNNITVVEGDASALEKRPHDADIFLANINRNIITGDIERYASAMAHGARLTVSGFYVDDRPIVIEAAAKVGFKPTGMAEMDRWSSITFKKV